MSSTKKMEEMFKSLKLETPSVKAFKEATELARKKAKEVAQKEFNEQVDKAFEEIKEEVFQEVLDPTRDKEIVKAHRTARSLLRDLKKQNEQKKLEEDLEGLKGFVDKQIELLKPNPSEFKLNYKKLTQKDIDKANEFDEELTIELWQKKLPTLEIKDTSTAKAINEVKESIEKDAPQRAWERFTRYFDRERFASSIARCLLKLVVENSALREVFRSAFIAYMESVNSTLLNGRAKELIVEITRNVNRLDSLQSIVTGFRLSTPVRELQQDLNDTPLDELAHALFDSANEEELFISLVEVFPDIVGFIQGFNLQDLTDRLGELGPDLSNDIKLPVDFQINAPKSDIEKLSEETDRIFEEVIYTSLVTAAGSLLELAETCDFGSEDLYRVPDVAEFRQASKDGDQIFKFVQDANNLYDRETFCDFLKYAEGPVTDFIPSEYHEIVREIYENQDYNYCDDFNRADRFRSPCTEDPKDVKNLRALLKSLRPSSVDFDLGRLNELLDEDSYDYLTDFTGDQVDKIASRLGVTLNSQYAYLVDRKGKPETNLTGTSKELYEDYNSGLFNSNDYKDVDPELKKQVEAAKKLLEDKEVKTESYAELFGKNFVVSQDSGPITKFSGEKLKYGGKVTIPKQTGGFLTDQKVTVETSGMVDYSLIKYEKTGQKAVGYVAEGLKGKLLEDRGEDRDEVESCREYSVTIDPKNVRLGSSGIFSAFGRVVLVDIIEITRKDGKVEVYLTRFSGDEKNYTLKEPFPLHEEDFGKYLKGEDYLPIRHGAFPNLYNSDNSRGVRAEGELPARNYFKKLLFNELSGKSDSKLFGETKTTKTTSVNADGNYQYYTLDNGVKKLEEFDDSYHDLIYGNIFKTFWDIVSDSPLAKRTKLSDSRSVPNASLLQLGSESVCKGKQLVDFGDVTSFLPRAQALGPQEVDEDSVAIKSYLKLSAVSYILSAPFSYSVSEPNRKLYRMAAPLYVHALRDSKVSDEIREEVEKNCKAYEDLFVEYCFTAHSGFRGNFNTPSFKFIPKVKRQGDSWFYRTEESPDAYQQWVLDNYHRDLPFFIGESLVIKEIKKPQNKELYGALPDLVGKRINSEILLEKLKENTPKADKLSDHYEFTIQSELLFHAPLSYTNELYANPRRSSAWDSYGRQKETFRATVQRDFRYETEVIYRTKRDAFQFFIGADQGGTTVGAVGATLTLKYRSQVEGERGELGDWELKISGKKPEVYKSIKEINNAGEKTILSRSPLGEYNPPIEEKETEGGKPKPPPPPRAYRSFDELLKQFKKEARGGVTRTKFPQHKKYMLVKREIKETVFPLATKSLKLNIEKLSDIVKITPKKTVSYTEKGLEQDSEDVWKCVDVTKTRSTPKKVEYVFNVDQCFEKLQGLIEETSKYKQVKKYFDDPLLFSFVVTDEVVYNTEFADDILEFYQKVREATQKSLEGRVDELKPEDFSFNIAQLVFETLIGIVKSVTERMDPNISVASALRDLFVGTVQTGLDIGLSEFGDVPSVGFPVTPFSLALMATGLFPTPFGIIYLALEDGGLLVDFLSELDEQKNQLPIRSSREC